MAPTAAATSPRVGMRENLRRRAQRARRAIRKVAPKMKFTGEKPSAMLYLGVAMVALLKDLVDFVGVGSLPGVGTVVTITRPTCWRGFGTRGTSSTCGTCATACTRFVVLIFG